MLTLSKVSGAARSLSTSRMTSSAAICAVSAMCAGGKLPSGTQTEEKAMAGIPCLTLSPAAATVPEYKVS